MGNLIRKYKLHSIEPCLTDDELDIINYVVDNFSNLNINNSYSQTSIIYINKEMDWVIECDNTMNVVWVNGTFWYILNKKFKISDLEIIDILKYFIKIFYKIEKPKYKALNTDCIDSILNFKKHFKY